MKPGVETQERTQQVRVAEWTPAPHIAIGAVTGWPGTWSGRPGPPGAVWTGQGAVGSWHVGLEGAPLAIPPDSLLDT